MLVSARPSACFQYSAVQAAQVGSNNRTDYQYYPDNNGYYQYEGHTGCYSG